MSDLVCPRCKSHMYVSFNKTHCEYCENSVITDSRSKVRDPWWMSCWSRYLAAPVLPDLYKYNTPLDRYRVASVVLALNSGTKGSALVVKDKLFGRLGKTLVFTDTGDANQLWFSAELAIEHIVDRHKCDYMICLTLPNT